MSKAILRYSINLTRFNRRLSRQFVSPARVTGACDFDSQTDSRDRIRVEGLSEVLRRMLVFRVIAAADMTAGLAEPQADPRVTRLQALLAPGGVERHILHLVQV